MVTRIYTIPGRLHWNDKGETDPEYVFIFIAEPYRETIKLYPYHKRRRVWAKQDCFGKHVITSINRTRQIERWCKLSGFKCEAK